MFHKIHDILSVLMLSKEVDGKINGQIILKI